MAAENPPSQHDEHVRLHDRVGAGTEEFAERWAAATVDHDGSNHEDARDLLHRNTTLLHDTLVQEPFSAAPARAVGASMVAGGLTGPTVLEHTIRLLCNDFRPTLGLGARPEVEQRLGAVAGALAAGYSEALREQAAAEQESANRAVVDARDRAEAALQASDLRFRTVFDSSVMGIVIAHLDGRVEQTNPALSTILHYTPAEFTRRSLAAFVHPDDLPVVRAEYDRLVEGQIEWYRNEIRLIRGDGDPVWVQITAALVRDTDNLPAYWITLVENLTDTKMLVRGLTHQSLHDELTGLPNRAQFLRRLEVLLAGADHPDRIALWYLDLDGFKVVNDSLGHEIGDRVIQTIAERLRAVIDDEILIARVGGDEFAALVGGSRCGSELEVMLNGVLDEIGKPIHLGQHEISMSASIGVVDREAKGLTPTELLRAANLTLHWAKSDGKGQWTPYDEERNRRDRARFRLAVTLPAALANGEFSLSFRPVIGLADNATVAMDTVVNWEHPERGSLARNDFLDLAEETGLAVPLGQWTLREACRAAGRWQGDDGRPSPVVRVRLSSRQARDQDLVRDVLEAIDEGGIAADRLHLLLDLRDLLGAEREDVREAVSVLTELGVGLIVTDFGARPLHAGAFGGLPVAAVELAPDYLAAHTAHDPDPLAGEVFAQLVTAAHRHAATVIVGGVSTKDDADLLRATGVDAAHGVYFGTPGPAESAAPVSASPGRPASSTVDEHSR